MYSHHIFKISKSFPKSHFGHTWLLLYEPAHRTCRATQKPNAFCAPSPFCEAFPTCKQKENFFNPNISKKAQTEYLIFIGSPESLDVFLCFDGPGLVVEHHVTSCGYVLTLSKVDSVEVLTFDRFCYSTQHFYNLKGQCWKKNNISKCFELVSKPGT